VREEWDRSVGRSRKWRGKCFQDSCSQAFPTSTFKRLKYSKTIAPSYSHQNRIPLDTMDFKKGATLYCTTELTQQLPHWSVCAQYTTTVLLEVGTAWECGKDREWD